LRRKSRGDGRRDIIRADTPSRPPASITVPYLRAEFFRAPLILALLMLAVATPHPASSGELISLLGPDHLDAASSRKPGRTDAHPALLFDMETEPVFEGVIFDKWRRVKTDVANEYDALRRCLAGSPCPPVARRLLDISAAGAGRSGRARIGLINRAVDLSIAPVSDLQQWGVVDRWSAAFETLQSRRGDCEDYAILKYVALLAAGVPAADVKIVIPKNLSPREEHAAVAARADGAWFILDNLTLVLLRDSELARAIPEYVLDLEGARRFLPGSRSGRGRRGDSTG
jgi:predicted transglutaminase-like cysteine proteinase